MTDRGQEPTVQPTVPPPAPLQDGWSKPASRRRSWLIPVIVASVAVAIAGIVGLVIAVSTLLTTGFVAENTVQNTSQNSEHDAGQFTNLNADQPLVPGDPAPPVAAEPLDCITACFTSNSVGSTIADESAFKILGVPDTVRPWGYYHELTAADLQTQDAASWIANDGAPDSCFFAYSTAPYGATLRSTDESSLDPINYTGTHADAAKNNDLEQSVRLFRDSSSAEAFMMEQAKSVENCLTMNFGTRTKRITVEVRPAAAITIPASVGMTGWSYTDEISGQGRSYIVNLQRGNMVVRVRLHTDGSITEPVFRHFVGTYAVQFAAIEPVNK